MPGGLHPPPAVIASWPKPNYINPDTHGPGLIIICCVFGSLTFLIVGARLWVRFFVQRKGGLDDWLILVALVPILGLLIVIGISEHYGFSRHIWDNPVSAYVPQRKLIFTAEHLYLLANCLIKCSILLFYRRIIGGTTLLRSFIIITHITLASIVVTTVTFHVGIFAECRPMGAFWDQANIAKLQAGYQYKCDNEFAHLMTAFVVSCVQDFVVTSLPAIMLYKLQMPIRQKLALATVFAVGYIVCIIAVMRIYYIYVVFNASYDVSWVSWYVWIFMLLEILIGAMCASAPAMKVFFSSFLGSGTRSRLSNSIPSSHHSRKGWVMLRKKRSEVGSHAEFQGDANSSLEDGMSVGTEKSGRSVMIDSLVELDSLGGKERTADADADADRSDTIKTTFKIDRSVL